MKLALLLPTQPWSVLWSETEPQLGNTTVQEKKRQEQDAAEAEAERRANMTEVRPRIHRVSRN